MATKEQQIINARYINQRLTLDKFEKTAVQEIQEFYTAARAGVLADINRAVARNYDISTQSRLFDLLDEINSMIAGTQASLTNSVAGAAGHAGAFSYKDTNQILSWDGRNKNFNYVALSSSQIQALVKTEPLAGKNLGEWLWTALDADNGALRADINASRVRGLGYNRVLTSLGDRYDDLFDADRARRDLETVTKSYIQATNAKAHSDIYTANRDVMKGVEWSAIMENGNSKTGRGTCPRCQGLDGNTYKTEQEGPAMPLHARCRCMYLPLTLTWKELFGDDFDVEEMAEVERKWYERDPKTRRIMDTGRTGLNYGEWWETKPANWQDNAIGPYRAGLVRNKSMQFSSIVDTKTGRLIPLDELVKKGVISQDELNLVRRSKSSGGGKKGGGAGGGVGGAAAAVVVPVPVSSPIKKLNTDMPSYEDEIRSNNFESGMLIDKNGDHITTNIGEDHSVQWSLEHLEAAKGGILTHNHPGGGSFSDSDIQVMNRFKLAEIRAVAQHERYGRVNYSAKMIGENTNSDIYVSEMMDAAYSFAKKQTDLEFNDGSIDVTDANYLLHHRKWELFALWNPEWFEYKRVVGND